MQKPTSLHVEKPWGSFTQYAFNEQCTVKILTCNPGQRLSLQRDRNRHELWVALDNGAVVELDDKVLTPDAGTELWLPAGSIHRLSCAEGVNHPVRIMEVSYGVFDENDIERLEDVYGRN